MAHFAQLDENNVVIGVYVVDNKDTSDINGVESESIGVAFNQKLFGVNTIWKQTSYNNNMRGNYAGVGFTYMENVATLGVASTDIFIRQQPYPSWTIGIQTAQWYSPVGEKPGLTDLQKSEGYYTYWDEAAYQADTGNPKTVGWGITNV
mgnify:CR=1 FL=1|tara:strand:+ start:1564 stop:2010 length:447 start_codon:yes stop_codon:yes gene_type:complete